MGQSVNETPASILIIDDHPLLRRGVAQLLELEDDLELVGDTGEPQQGVGLAAELDPDMILLDLNMPGMDGIQTLKALRNQRTAPATPDIHSLTQREREILRELAGGLSNKLIARKLDISEGTVKVHVKHLLKKLNLRSRVEAAVWSVQEGIDR